MNQTALLLIENYYAAFNRGDMAVSFKFTHG
jgi:hypothetical protein